MSKKERQKTSDNEYGKVLYQQPMYSRTTSSLENLKYEGKALERNSRTLFSIFEEITGRGPKRTKSASKINEAREYKQLEFDSKNSTSQIRKWGNLSEQELKRQNNQPVYQTLETVSLSKNAQPREWGSLTSEELTITKKQSFNTKNSSKSDNGPSRSKERNNYNGKRRTSSSSDFLDMKKFIFSDKVEAAISTQKTLEKQRKLSFEKMNLISKQPKSLDLINSHLVLKGETTDTKLQNPQVANVKTSLEHKRSSSPLTGTQEKVIEPEVTSYSLNWRRPSLPEQDVFDLNNSPWLLKDSTEVNEAFSNLSLRKSIKRNTSYKDSHINISSRNSIELEHIVELQEPGFVKAVLNLSSEPSDASDVDAKDINGNIVETISNELALKGISVDSAEFDPVLPDQTPPEMIFQVNRKPVEDYKKPDSVPASLEWNVQKEPTIMKPLQWFKSFLKKPKPKENEYPLNTLVAPNRLELFQERAVYTLSHLKLSESSRIFREQVLITNLMLYILSVHSDVTIHGRGPRKHRKKKGKRRKPRLEVEKKSDSDSEEDKPVRKIGKPLISFEESDEDDDVPLAILKKK
jgi:hypothetical protein